MQNLIARKNVKYAGQQYVAGDPFVAKPGHARVLIALRKAERAQDDDLEIVPHLDLKPETKGKAEKPAKPKKAAAEPTAKVEPDETPAVETEEPEIQAPVFAVGDKVVLKSGGPDMTIESIDEDGKIAAFWSTEDGEEAFDTFVPEALDRAPSTTSDADA